MDLLLLFASHAYQYRPEQPFTLSSGGTSPEYLDCRVALSEPLVLHNICKTLLPWLPKEVKAVGGLTMGADPLAVGLSLRAFEQSRMLRWFSVRKETKVHGRGRLIEGSVNKGEKVVVLEDVVTTGASTIKAIRACREAELDVVQVLAIVDREQGGMEAISKELGPGRIVHAAYSMDQVRVAARNL